MNDFLNIIINKIRPKLVLVLESLRRLYTLNLLSRLFRKSRVIIIFEFNTTRVKKINRARYIYLIEGAIIQRYNTDQ